MSCLIDDLKLRYLLAGFIVLVGLYFKADLNVLLGFLAGVILPSTHAQEIIEAKLKGV